MTLDDVAWKNKKLLASLHEVVKNDKNDKNDNYRFSTIANNFFIPDPIVANLVAIDSATSWDLRTYAGKILS